jgi:hypothetical protein
MILASTTQTFARSYNNWLPFLDKPCRVEWLDYFWVVELLSPALSGLGLGSYALSLYLLSPC